MRKNETHSRSSTKEASHERIVGAAARAIRRSGYNGTGVADIMKEAGLTHGAFYTHFESREAMLAEAADRAGAESNSLAASVIAAVPSDQALQALMQVYLSKEHLAGTETGCPRGARLIKDKNARLLCDGLDDFSELALASTEAAGLCHGVDINIQSFEKFDCAICGSLVIN